jgi:hypothetical protein
MATENTDRREKIVMGLGIVTIILFSANLLTAVANYFWPNHSLPLIHSTMSEVQVERGVYELHIRQSPHRRHRIVMRDLVSKLEIDVESEMDVEFERELARLERSIERETERMTRELTIHLEQRETKPVIN